MRSRSFQRQRHIAPPPATYPRTRTGLLIAPVESQLNPRPACHPNTSPHLHNTEFRESPPSTHNAVQHPLPVLLELRGYGICGIMRG
jgi:hypothetical protein